MALLTEGRWLATPVQQPGSGGDMLNILFDKSANKGTLGGTVKFEFTDGPNKGQAAYWTGWMSDGALANTVKAWRAIGFVGDDIDAFNDQDPLTLREVELTVENEEYKGKPQSKVQWVNKPRRFMARDEIRAAAADVKARLAQFIEPDDTLGPDPVDDLSF